MKKQKITFNKQTTKNKNQSLAVKTSLSVAIVLAVFLVIMVYGSPLAASIKLNRSVTKHLTAISTENGIEDYLLYTIWNIVGEDDLVCGMGVFFEPDAFDPVLKTTLCTLVLLRL